MAAPIGRRVLLVFVLVHVVLGENVTDTKSCPDLYADGVTAYLDERWQDCIVNFEAAVAEYHRVRQITVDCRIKCQQEDGKYMSPQDTEHLYFYETLVKKTLCLLKCKKKNFIDNTSTIPIPSWAEQTFSSLKPYDYLQLCYYQSHLPQKAASASFTYLVANPHDATMVKNLQFYSTLPEVDMTKIENMEAKNFVAEYIHGSDAYKKEDYKAVIKHMEASLEDYLREDEKCRAYCEGPFDQGWFPDFTSSIANHFTFCLKCKRKCSKNLNSLNGEVHDDLLPSHYHFLQYAYDKVGKEKKAYRAVESYLLFYPDDETMLSNKRYYMKKLSADKSLFVPRKEAVKYVLRDKYETKLLDFIETEFKSEQQKTQGDTNETEEKNATPEKKEAAQVEMKLSPPPIVKFEWPKYKTKNSTKVEDLPVNDQQISKEANTSVSHQMTVESEEIRRMKKRALEQFKRTSVKKIKVVMGEKELRGKYRFLADGFAQETECKRLIELAQIAAVQGDGYIGNKSPHSKYEKFEGVTLGRAALLVYFGLMEISDLELYLNVSEVGRDYVERYFNLKKKLYFNFTHLVCRTALNNETPSNRSDMSHAVHADNCNLMPSGLCTRQPPAYTWRDYSAIIYLNDDFDGGEFVFAEDVKAKNIQSVVKPTCGRLVGFSAGKENLHGVKGVRRGSRCAIGLWFTFNQTHNEVERELAQKVLTQVRQEGSITEQLLRELNRHVTLDVPDKSYQKIKHD